MAERPVDPAQLDAGRMPFFEHLRELRDRLRNAVLCFLGGFAIAYAFNQQIYAWILRPLINVMYAMKAADPSLPDPTINFGSPTEPFWVYLSVSLWAGIFISSPLIFYQLWKFIAPGLYQHERRIGVVFAAVSGVFFAGGALFCYYLVLEQMLGFLLSYATSNLGEVSGPFDLVYDTGQAIAVRPLIGMRDYLDLARGMMLGFGLVFELPLLIYFLAAAGLVTHRGLWKFNRYWIVIAFVIGAILTPGPDIGSQIAMSLPLVVLYEISIGIAWVVTRRK